MKAIDIERHKILVFEDYMVVYLENTKEFTEKLELREILVCWAN